jgi:hypothetical protein
MICSCERLFMEEVLAAPVDAALQNGKHPRTGAARSAQALQKR